MATYNYIFNQVELEEVTSIDTYSGEDINLIDSFSVNSSFDQFKNYAELHYYSLDGQVLNSVSNYTNFKSPQDSNTANQGTLDSVTLKLEEDLLSEGYDYGDVYLLYNFLNDPYTDNSLKSEFFIEEISPDRFEIRLLSKNVSNENLLKYTENFKRRLANSDISDYKLNLGSNRFLLATNIDTLQYKNFTSVVVRLYKQLPQDIGIKTVLSIAETVSDPVAFRVTTEIIPDEIKIPYLKGPNFSAGDSLLKNTPTKYFSINELFSYPVTNSYYEIRSLFNEKGIELTIDHTDYSDFIHFSSAKERLENFKYKLDLITLYQSESNAKTNSTGYPNLTASLDAYSGSVEYYNELIEKILVNFDHYDRYLYYESSSYAWPKLNSTKPYILDTSVTGTNWYNGQLSSASLFDAQNPHQLINTVPEFLREDPNNSKYLLFIDMIGQHFDNLWLYAKNITDKYDGDNRLNFGISKDLLENALQNFGVRLYTSNKSTQDLFTMFTGEAFSTGSESYVDTVVTGSTEIVSEENYRKQIYKRLYHNLPYLLKSKGTERGLRALLSIFGVPSLYSSGSHSGLVLNQYGGGLSGNFNLGNQYYATSSLGKIRIDNTGSLIPSGSYTYGNTLSKYVSIEKRDKKYTNDLNILEAGFSPATYLNRYIIASSSADGFDIDSVLGDPRLVYSSSYEGLATKAKEYLTPVINSANQNNGSLYNLKDFTRLLKFYDNVLFKTIRDFVPARANINTGIIIKPHLLERSKIKQVKSTFQRHNEFTSSIAIGFRTGSHGDSFGARDTYITSYSESIHVPTGVDTIYPHNHEEAKFNGELSGSYFKISIGELNDENRYKYDSPNPVEYQYNFIDADADCLVIWGEYSEPIAASPTPTQTVTSTPTPTPTSTSDATNTPTPTQTVTSTPTPTPTQTVTSTPTQTVTPTPTPTSTSDATNTPTPTQTVTSTPTPTPTQTVTSTPTPTQTVTSTPTPTPTNTNTPTPTPSGETAVCENVWVADTVDGVQYGIQYLKPGETEPTRVPYGSVLGTVDYVYGGVSGSVISVCSTLTPVTWDFDAEGGLGAIVDLGSDVVVLAAGNSCVQDGDCEFTPPATPTQTVTPTPTPTPSTTYNYYSVRGCPGSFYENQDLFIRTFSTLPDTNGNTSTSSVIYYNGSSFYAYGTLLESEWVAGGSDLGSVTYSGIVDTGCPTPTPTPTPSTPYKYYSVRGCPGSFYENQDLFVRTLSLFTDTNGSTSTSSVIYWSGSSFYAYGTLTESEWNTGGSDLGSVSYSGIVDTGCPVYTGDKTLVITDVEPDSTIDGGAGLNVGSSQEVYNESYIGTGPQPLASAILISYQAGEDFTINSVDLNDGLGGSYTYNLSDYVTGQGYYLSVTGSYPDIVAGTVNIDVTINASSIPQYEHELRWNMNAVSNATYEIDVVSPSTAILAESANTASFTGTENTYYTASFVFTANNGYEFESAIDVSFADGTPATNITQLKRVVSGANNQYVEIWYAGNIGANDAFANLTFSGSPTFATSITNAQDITVRYRVPGGTGTYTDLIVSGSVQGTVTAAPANATTIDLRMEGHDGKYQIVEAPTELPWVTSITPFENDTLDTITHVVTLSSNAGNPDRSGTIRLTPQDGDIGQRLDIPISQSGTL